MTKQINVRFPELEAEALRLYSRKYYISQSNIIRNGVQREILGKMQKGESGIHAYKKLIDELK
jgi:Arc/MetJ-type ribon-helix-helix transcriptional regulator